MFLLGCLYKCISGRKKGLLYLLFSLLVLQSKAQVLNLDRENGQDSIRKPFSISLACSFSSDKQRNNFLEFSNSLELSYKLRNNYVFILLNQSDQAFNGKTSIQNDGFFQVRFRDHDTRFIAPDVFAQYQWNGILGLENRSLAGINARMRLIEKDRTDLYASVGEFYEIENWNPALPGFNYTVENPGTVYRELFRLNVVAKFAYKINDRIDFSCINYVQFPMNGHFIQPRWFFDSNLYLEISKHWSVLLHYDHNYDAYRALPIDEYYYSVNVGFQVKY